MAPTRKSSRVRGAGSVSVKSFRLLGSLTPKQQEAVALLVAGKTFTAIAEDLGITRQALYEWRQIDTFRKAVRSLQSDAMAGAIGILKVGAQAAARRLVQTTDDGEALTAPRVPAARGVLEFAFRAVEVEELAEKLRALEERLRASGALRD